MQETAFIRKKDTNIIKGMALVFMLIHHFFTFPQWIPENITYRNVERIGGFLNEPFAICVPIFAFLTGYFYFFTPEKNYRYSLRKSTDLWVNYLCTFLLLLIPAIALECYEFDVVKFLMECVGLYLPTMKFCWYVSFYFMAIFILPQFSKSCEKNPALSVLVCVLGPVALAKILQPFANRGVIGIIYDLSTYLERFCCVAMGYIFAKFQVFERMRTAVSLKSKFASVLCNFLLMVIAFLGVGSGKILGAFSAPLFVFAFANIVHMVENIKVMLPLTIVGKYSLSIWFLHSFFYNQCEIYTKQILYMPYYPILVFLWGLGICLIAAVIIDVPIRFLVNLKNKGMDMLLGTESKREK